MDKKLKVILVKILKKYTKKPSKMFLRDFWIKLDNVNEKAMEMERK